MRRWLAGLAELLDCWRVYATVLVSLTIAVLPLWIVQDVELALLLSGGAVIVGVVAGVVWHARTTRR